MNSKLRREITGVVESLGYTVVSMIPAAKHIAVTFTDGIHTACYHTSSTPSDWRELKNVKRDLKWAMHELTIRAR